jgi:hypothetical protein
VIHAARHTIRAAWPALLLLAACLVGCDGGESASSASPGGATARAPGASPLPAQAAADAIEIQLRPTAGGPPTRLQIRVTPFPSSDAWVPNMASTMHRALAACIPAGEPAPMFSLELGLEARDARLHAPPGATAEPDLRGCVYKALDQAEIAGLGPEPRSLRMQATPVEPGR